MPATGVGKEERGNQQERRECVGHFLFQLSDAITALLFDVLMTDSLKLGGV